MIRQTDRQTDRRTDGSEFIIIQKSIYDVSLILSYSKCMHKPESSHTLLGLAWLARAVLSD